MSMDLSTLKMEKGKGIRGALYWRVIISFIALIAVNGIFAYNRESISIVDTLLNFIMLFFNVIIVNLMILTILRKIRRVQHDEGLFVLVRRLWKEISLLILFLTSILVSLFFTSSLLRVLWPSNLSLHALISLLFSFIMLFLYIYNAVTLIFIVDGYNVKDAIENGAVFMKENIKILCFSVLKKCGLSFIISLIAYQVMSFVFQLVLLSTNFSFLSSLFFLLNFLMIYVYSLLILVAIVGAYLISDMLLELICLYEYKNLQRTCMQSDVNLEANPLINENISEG